MRFYTDWIIFGQAGGVNTKPLFNRNDGDAIAALIKLSRPERQDVSGDGQIFAYRHFHGTGAMPVNDHHRTDTIKSALIEKPLQPAQSGIDSFTAQIECVARCAD